MIILTQQDQELNKRKYQSLRNRMQKYVKFLELDFEEYMHRPQNYDVSLFNDLTSDALTGMSITPK